MSYTRTPLRPPRVTDDCYHEKDVYDCGSPYTHTSVYSYPSPTTRNKVVPMTATPLLNPIPPQNLAYLSPAPPQSVPKSPAPSYMLRTPQTPASTWNWSFMPMWVYPTPQPGKLKLPTAGELMYLSGGYPFPGSEPYVGAAPQPWPPEERTLPIHLAPWLIPNPNDTNTSILQWDVRLHPTTALRVTGRSTLVSLPKDKEVWDGDAVYPSSGSVLAVANVGRVASPIGRISVNSTKTKEILYSIWDYFQEPPSSDELQTACDRIGYDRITEAFWARLSVEGGLREHNARTWKRVDLLGRETQWFGAWINADSRTHQWTLEFGLIARPNE
jgi:hypothetical protein